MTIEVKNAEVIIKVLKEKLEKAKANLKSAVDDEVTRMVLRTRNGKDIDGSNFAPYTPAYNKRKASLKSGFTTRTGKKGKNAKQVKGSYSATPQKPDLTLSGNMLASIQTKVEDTSTGAVATVFFNSALEAAKAQGNQKKRRFFGFAEEQVQRIKRKLFGQ
jgi:hypothetical protein